MMKKVSFRKAKKLVFTLYHLFKKKRKHLKESEIKEIREDFQGLQNAILEKNKEKTTHFYFRCYGYTKTKLKKNLFNQLLDLVGALVFALIIALAIRQLWFELYEIPTGSMRPTFKEKDRLVVSKTSFGINFPFHPGHFYFDPDLVKRSETAIFTVENMDVKDPDMLYFYLFPGKKQLVKRIIGKPGDTLYFYGGEIYGIDQFGNDISRQLQSENLKLIDHIPFIRFEGNVTVSEPKRYLQTFLFKETVVHQVNEPICKLTFIDNQHLQGEMLSLKTIRSPSQFPIEDYGKLWGIDNFAVAKLLTKEQVKDQGGILYLELKHHPSLSSLKLGKDQLGRLRPMFSLATSIIPLQEEHLRNLFFHLYTARFIVNDGYVGRYSFDRKFFKSGNVAQLPGVPDGTYEFYYGKAYQIIFGGIAKEVPSDHPLYHFSPERLQFLFNFGIDFDWRYYDLNLLPEGMDTSRYVYFRDGNLYAMGEPFLFKGDPTLEKFIAKEKEKQFPFIDANAPLLPDGTLDMEKIKRYGLLVPSEMYFVLGDNHAMSGDSREFGFVPQNNLRGSPSWIFWPPGSRFGKPNQLSTPIFTLPNFIIWGAALIIVISWRVVYRKRKRLPLQLPQ
ncbi:MAG: signal peptidase I [Chlamydiae bacterium]|nr:signal peptidase I [Chlamydiota bacterium]